MAIINVLDEHAREYIMFNILTIVHTEIFLFLDCFAWSSHELWLALCCCFSFFFPYFLSFPFNSSQSLGVFLILILKSEFINFEI
jgi:hypothetical protein